MSDLKPEVSEAADCYYITLGDGAYYQRKAQNSPSEKPLAVHEEILIALCKDKLSSPDKSAKFIAEVEKLKEPIVMLPAHPIKATRNKAIEQARRETAEKCAIQAVCEVERFTRLTDKEAENIMSRIKEQRK